jgi:hypothetical protein
VMDLHEIESVTDALLEKLASTESAAEVRDLCFRLDGFYRGAQIKAIVFGVDRQASSEEFRARELAAMERAAQAASMAVMQRLLEQQAEPTVEYPCADAADAYQDMASKLQEILAEGTL